MPHPFEIHHDLAAHCFEARKGTTLVGMLMYEREGTTVSLLHTVTDPAHRGEGIASALVLRVFTDARKTGMSLVVICPFVESWVARHPDQADLVIEDAKSR